MNYKFQVGDLVKVNHTGSLGLVTGLVGWSGPGDRDVRYTVLIQGVTYKLHGVELRKVNK